LGEHSVAAVCKYNKATAGATLVVQQEAETSKLSLCVAKVDKMLVGRPVKKTNCTTSPQQIVQVEFGLYRGPFDVVELIPSTS